MKNIPIVIWFILGFSFFSCKKSFLDTPPSSSIEVSEFFKNLRLDACKQFLSGAYQELGQNFFHGLNVAYVDLVADNLKPSNSIFIQQYSWSQIPTDGTGRVPSTSTLDMTPIWLAGYHIIGNLNFILENVDNFREDNEAVADSIKGQALAMRALIHFQLVNVFAQPYKYTQDASHPGIPYVTTSDYTTVTPRMSVGDVYSQVINDLQAAIILLPDRPSSSVYLGGNAAKALLARIYLYKGDYAGAKGPAIAVSTQVPIMTTDYPAKLFTTQETEALFQLPPSAAGVGGRTYTTNFEGIYFASGTSQAFLATNDIFNLIKENPTDVRSAWFTAQAGNYRITKFPANVITGFPNASGGYFHTIIRSSEMYLTAAECLARLGDEAGAISYLDKIRKRAVPTADPTTATGPALIDSILKERRKELCFEGQRMFDLLRLQKGVARVDVINAALSTLPYPNDKAIAPVPVRDVISLSYSQNSGY
jgi:starch-binding outer membrane protein, SusD/RagB family